MSPSPSPLLLSICQRPAALVLGMLAWVGLCAAPGGALAQTPANGRGQGTDPDANLTAVRCDVLTQRFLHRSGC